MNIFTDYVSYDMAAFLVFIQFISLVLLSLSAPILPESYLALTLYMASAVVGMFAFQAMRRSKLRISPKVHPEAKLVTNGIYRFIRHPMYLAVILGAGAMLVNQFTPIRIGIMSTLLVDLVIKMIYEESMLQKKFGELYTEYQKRSKRLIPYIF